MILNFKFNLLPNIEADISGQAHLFPNGISMQMIRLKADYMKESPIFLNNCRQAFKYSFIKE